MDLILTVVECPPHANMLNHTKVFRSHGGLIGRADSNDWVLPDTERILSSRHLEVKFADGKFVVLDHSTNGTFINENQAPLGPGNLHELKAGDILICGEYQLKASLKAPVQEAAMPSGLGAVDFLDSGDRTTFNHATAAKQQAASSAMELDSWLEPAAPKPQAQGAHDWGSILAEQAAAPVSDNDPWGSTPSSGTSMFLGDHQETDPLAALDKSKSRGFAPTPTSSSSWDDGDDWWKSEPDNSPVEQQQMRIPVPQAAPQSAPSAPAAFVSDPFAADPFASSPDPFTAQASAPAADNPFAASSASVAADDLGGQGIDSLFGLAPTPPQPAQPAPAQPAYQAPPAAVPPVAVAAQTTAPQAPPSPMAAADLRQLAALLGVPNLRDDQLQGLLPEVSGIVNETVSRLIDLLRARTAIKNELRVQHTMIQSVDNNPLKFSANATDALKVMFSSDASAFMRPGDAIRDSFDDLSDHQVAVLKGMHAAYEAMFRHFDPDNLKRHINARDSLLGNKDAKQWVGFEQYFKTLKGDYEATYNRLFGEEFARAYERQLAELKNARALNRQ